jgi:hypothetical protein
MPPTVYIAEIYPILAPFFSTPNWFLNDSRAGRDPKIDPSYP